MRLRHLSPLAPALALCLLGAMPALAQQEDYRDYSGQEPPPRLVLPAGTWISVRLDQPISSDHNQPGDRFTASLAQPLVVDGFVVARRGQIIEGRVAVAEKAGRVKGTSRLGFELTEISLVDGRQVPIVTQLMESEGGISAGRDAAAIATTTGVGAAIGAAADGGFGAGMGALAGAAASTIGVLVTRGRPTEVYPEDVLTFRTLAPLTISTAGSERAFLPVSQADYGQRGLERRDVPRRTWTPRRRYYGPRYGYYGAYPPYVYGPGVYFYPGPRYFYPRTTIIIRPHRHYRVFRPYRHHHRRHGSW